MSKSFLILRRIESDIIINVRRSSGKVHVILVRLKWNLNFLETFSKSIKFHENPSSGSPVLPCGRTDGQTDMTKLMVAFRNFANAPTNSTFFPRSTFLSSSIELQLFPYTILTDWFLVAFAKFRDVSVSFDMSVCPSVRSSVWNNSAHTGRIFKKFDISEFFEHSSRKFKFH